MITAIISICIRMTRERLKNSTRIETMFSSYIFPVSSAKLFERPNFAHFYITNLSNAYSAYDCIYTSCRNMQKLPYQFHTACKGMQLKIPKHVFKPNIYCVMIACPNLLTDKNHIKWTV